jgi:hypothetical protein
MMRREYVCIAFSVETDQWMTGRPDLDPRRLAAMLV